MVPYEFKSDQEISHGHAGLGEPENTLIFVAKILLSEHSVFGDWGGGGVIPFSVLRYDLKIRQIKSWF